MSAHSSLMFLTILILVVNLTACSVFGKKDPEVEVVVDNPVPLNVERQEPLVLDTPNLYIITRDNAEEVFDEMEKAGFDPVIIGFDDESFNAFAIDLERIQGFILKERDTTDAYRLFYEDGTKSGE